MRAALAITILITIAVGCATRDSQPKVTAYTPPIILTLQSIQTTNNNCRIAFFQMKNVSDMDMWFIGYGREHPDCVMQEKDSVGWDGSKDEGMLCGMGLGQHRIESGS